MLAIACVASTIHVSHRTIMHGHKTDHFRFVCLLRSSSGLQELLGIPLDKIQRCWVEDIHRVPELRGCSKRLPMMTV